MKRIFVGIVLGLFLLPTLVFAQAPRVNTRQFSLGAVKEDSSASATWLILATDIDTSEVITIANYDNGRIATAFRFGCAGTAHADSLVMGIYGEVSWDQTYWTLVDSITAATGLAAIVANSADTVLIEEWILPPAPYFRFWIKGHTANHKAAGWYIYPYTFKQQ